jgi:hypothetical protein
MSRAREEYTGIAHGVNNVKAGVSDFVDSWDGGGDYYGDDRGDSRAPGYIRVLALKSEAFL